MTLDKKKRFIINVVYLVLLIALGYIIVKYALGVFMPFIVGFLIAGLLRPIIKVVAKKIPIPDKVITIFIVIIFYGLAFLLFSWLGIRIFVGVKEFVSKLPSMYYKEIEPAIYKLFGHLEERMSGFDPMFVQVIQNLESTLSQSMGSILSNVSSRALSFISSFVLVIPGLFISIMVSLISSLFFAIDYDKVIKTVAGLIPESQKGFFRELKGFAGGLGPKYFKAYALLMTITFLELALGLSILGLKGAVSIAATIAIIDILPVLGTGGILIPWAIIALIQGKIFLGIGLIVLYLAITFIRNILESRLVGKQVGMHPLVILVCIYVGLKLFGFIGIFVLPITVVMLKHLHDIGKLNLFNEKD